MPQMRSEQWRDCLGPLKKRSPPLYRPEEFYCYSLLVLGALWLKHVLLCLRFESLFLSLVSGGGVRLPIF